LGGVADAPVAHAAPDAFGGRLLNDSRSAKPDAPGARLLPADGRRGSIEEDWFGDLPVGQPLTQQYRIGLGLEVARLDRQIAREDLRRARQRVTSEVRTTYYQISATEQGILALRDLVSRRGVESVTTLLAEGVPAPMRSR
jgi:outer membrane protein TolC